MNNTKFSQPQEIDDATYAFPAFLGDLLPGPGDYPKEFLSYDNRWNYAANGLFVLGGRVTWKDGIDPHNANRHIEACLRSFQPKHEHKLAGVGYLLSLWADSVEVSSGDEA